MREILRELRIAPLDHMMLYEDNSACLTMIGQESKCKRSKHILTKIMYIKDLVTTGAIVSQHIKTDVMTADVLTKPLVGDTFKRHRQYLMGLQWEKRL
jgi:ribosomal protein L30/L7E